MIKIVFDKMATYQYLSEEEYIKMGTTLEKEKEEDKKFEETINKIHEEGRIKRYYTNNRITHLENEIRKLKEENEMLRKALSNV